MIKTTIVGYGKTQTKLMEHYMDRLEKYLPLYYPNISWQFLDVRLKEGTSKKYNENLKSKVLVYNPNIVFVELSLEELNTNNATFVSLDTYENELDNLINEIKSSNNRTGLNGCMPIPILITPIPMKESKEDRGCSNSRISQYTYRAKTVSAKHDCPIIDLFSIMRKQPQYEEQFINEEGTALNEKGVDLLYDIVFIELTRLINYQGVLKDRFIS
ncbi:SGNH/GDSL hydrolase family protein [Niameybacter massiliensis]|uniref:SGNH/GDSL hydrolase family protein n=1 Tax=Niameybacter massiliensis TaxID=1658108 RepID=UPI0006B67487|nr:SGNH/GDSL hydrolase family protein [Niameybacter massiliensis]